MNKKRWITLWMMILMMALVSGCAPQPSGEQSSEEAQEQTYTSQIYASFYPVYMMARPILKDVPGLELNCLVQPQDGCLRSYSLSDWDARLAAGADGLILAGEGLESFESWALALGESGPAVMRVYDGVELLGERVDADVSDEEINHFEGLNPWAWLSVDGARTMAESIAGMLSELDPDYAQMYEENFSAFSQELDALVEQMDEVMSGYQYQEAVLMHEGLKYMAQELGLNSVLTIEREPGEQTEGDDLTDLIEKINESGAKLLLVEKQIPTAFKRALEEAGFHLALIDTFSTHSAAAPEDDYQTTMLENVRQIVQASQGLPAGEFVNEPEETVAESTDAAQDETNEDNATQDDASESGAAQDEVV